VTYDAIERSVQGAVRVEIYVFALPSTTYRLTSFDEDVAFDGETYASAPLSRSQASLVQVGKVREVVVTIALDHPLAVELRRYGIPPQDTRVTIARFFVGDAESRVQWQGYIGVTSTDAQYTRITIPNRLDLALDCQLPATVAQRSCPHRLFDPGCSVDPVAGGWILSPTVASVSGTSLVVSSISGKPDQWARHGKVVRAADGEERGVVSQVGTALTLERPFRTLAIGNALSVYAGCDHSLGDTNGCGPKFANVLNFGGEPEMPINNPAAPTDGGIAMEV
jgi:uncharacterized phage protein (TIGR02218 family)